MKTKIFFILIVSLVFCGCSSTPAVQVDSTSTVKFANTVSVSPAPVTAIHLPSTTATPLPSITVVNNIQLTPTVQIEDEMCQTAGYLGLANDNYPNVYYSPTGKWSFVICEERTGDNITYPFLVFRSGESEPWTINKSNIA